MGNHIRQFARHHDELGASAVEYALVLTLIAVAIIAGATALGIAVGGMFTIAL